MADVRPTFENRLHFLTHLLGMPRQLIHARMLRQIICKATRNWPLDGGFLLTTDFIGTSEVQAEKKPDYLKGPIRIVLALVQHEPVAAREPCAFAESA